MSRFVQVMLLAAGLVLCVPGRDASASAFGKLWGGADRGTAGLAFAWVESSEHPVWLTFAALSGEATESCSQARDGTLEIARHDWIALSARGSKSDLLRLESWLAAPSHDAEHAPSNAAALRRVVAATAAFLHIAAGPQRDHPAHPAHLRFELKLVPDACRATTQIPHTLQAMASDLKLPMFRRTSEFVTEPRSLQHDMLLNLADMIAHEAAHSVQLMPFNQGRLAKLGLTLDQLGRTGRLEDMPTLEVGAMLVQHCITQAALPTPKELLIVESMWLDDREKLLNLLTPNGQPDSSHLAPFLRTLHRLLGEGIRGVEDGPMMDKLMGACAMVMRRPQAAVDGQSLPTAEEMRRGAEGLAAIRALGAPIRLQPGEADRASGARRR